MQPDQPNNVLSAAIRLDEYTYHLPEDRIAAYPVEPRDASKLLVYESGGIRHQRFHQLADFLPSDTLLVFNDTKVIPARLYFRRDTGALIEIFLLQPEDTHLAVHQALRQVGETTWHCMIGNKKRWREGETLTVQVSDAAQAFSVKTTLIDSKQNLVNFKWTPADYPFSVVLPQLGEIPLPPYLNRKATAKDAETYQTVYSKKEGAVAAPTAGLHFTERVFDTLKAKDIASEFITLHVGAGTFQPIKAENVLQHPMHIEQIVFSRDSVRRFCGQPDRIFVVGTTSMRSMESLYWYGVKLLANADAPFFIEKLYPYQVPTPLPSAAEAFGAVLAHMERRDLREIAGETQILIVPGYPFRVCKGLITNFHQPGSTLILLVAAFVGEDWRRIYDGALSQHYRFLSYGDSSLLRPHPDPPQGEGEK